MQIMNSFQVINHVVIRCTEWLYIYRNEQYINNIQADLQTSM